MGTVNLCFALKSWSWPCPLTAWLPVGCRPRAFLAVLIHPHVPKSLFCCQSQGPSSVTLYVWQGGRGAGYLGGGTEIGEMPSCVLCFPLPLVKRHSWARVCLKPPEGCCSWALLWLGIRFRDRPGLTSLLGSSLAVWSWTGLFTSLSLCFLLCEMRVMICPSQGGHEG